MQDGLTVAPAGMTKGRAGTNRGVGAACQASDAFCGVAWVTADHVLALRAVVVERADKA